MKKLLFTVLLLIAMTGCTDYKKSEASVPAENTEISSCEIITEKTYETSTADTIVSAEISTEIITAETSVTVQEVTIETSCTTEVPADGKLVRIVDYIPDAVIDLRYATSNNFTGTVLYDDSEAYLCYGTVRKLMNVQKELKEKGYRILIWDAYRSPEAQQKLWDVCPNPTYVADPRKGLTSHSCGNTIDISIVYADGSTVELPSGFDEFSSIADRDYSDVSDNAAANAMMLQEIMYSNGFTGYKGEWWDYSDVDKYVLEIIEN